MRFTTAAAVVLALASVTVTVTVAAPTPPAPPPPRAPAGGPGPSTQCIGGDAAGATRVVIDRGAIPNAKAETHVATIYATGAWTFTSNDVEGKPARSATGCLGNDDRATIEHAIASAPWTISHPKHHCMAMGTTFTNYTIDQTTFTLKTCGNDVLDDTSVAALAELQKVVDRVTAPTKMPCCKP